MTFYKGSMDGAKRGWQKRISKAMKERAEINQCRECQRKGAMRTVPKLHPLEPTIKQCRYCGSSR